VCGLWCNFALGLFFLLLCTTGLVAGKCPNRLRRFMTQGSDYGDSDI